jgi:hypothetical protein
MVLLENVRLGRKWMLFYITYVVKVLFVCYRSSASKPSMSMCRAENGASLHANIRLEWKWLIVKSTRIYDSLIIKNSNFSKQVWW